MLAETGGIDAGPHSFALPRQCRMPVGQRGSRADCVVLGLFEISLLSCYSSFLGEIANQPEPFSLVDFPAS